MQFRVLQDVPKYMNNLERQIVCAACLHPDGEIIVGPRHFDSTMHTLIAQGNKAGWNRAEQGFINTWGEFLTRTEAWVVAVHNKQITRFVGNQDESDVLRTDVKLYSENLY